MVIIKKGKFNLLQIHQVVSDIFKNSIIGILDWLILCWEDHPVKGRMFSSLATLHSMSVMPHVNLWQTKIIHILSNDQWGNGRKIIPNQNPENANIT